MKNPISSVDARNAELYYEQVIAPRWISLRASSEVIICRPQEVEP